MSDVDQAGLSFALTLCKLQGTNEMEWNRVLRCEFKSLFKTLWGYKPLWDLLLTDVKDKNESCDVFNK